MIRGLQARSRYCARTAIVTCTGRPKDSRRDANHHQGIQKSATPKPPRRPARELEAARDAAMAMLVKGIRNEFRGPRALYLLSRHHGLVQRPRFPLTASRKNTWMAATSPRLSVALSFRFTRASGVSVAALTPSMSSWPGLSRPSTSCLEPKETVDARHKAGQDDVEGLVA